MTTPPPPERPRMPVELAVKIREIIERRGAELKEKRARQAEERESKPDGYEKSG